MSSDQETPQLAAQTDGDPATAKFGWPKTPDGTIDWETVFESPDTGLIAMVSTANSHDMLYKVTETVIRQLFTRKGDEAEVDIFLGELTRITLAAQGSSADVESTRTAVVDLLRRIKTGRIEKARAYVDAQRLKKANSKKRRKTARRDDDRKIELKKRIMLMSAGGLAAALLIAGAVATLVVGSSGPEQQALANVGGTSGETASQNGMAITDPDPPRFAIEDSVIETGALGQLPVGTEEVQPSEPDPGPEQGIEFSAAGYPLGTLERADLAKLAPNVVTLEPILSSRNVGGGGARQIYILPVLSVRESDYWRDICKWGPSLTEAINAVLVRSLPKTGDVTDEHLVNASEVAVQMINQRLGGVMVDRLYLLRDVDRRLTGANARCRLIKPG